MAPVERRMCFSSPPEGVVSDDPGELRRDLASTPPQAPQTRRQRSASVVVGLAASGAGVAAVFLTSNEIGSATLLAAGVYFVVASFLGRFPRLKFGDNEIDPGEVEKARQESNEAKSDSGEAKEGLGEAMERLAKLEARVNNIMKAEVPVPGVQAPPGSEQLAPPEKSVHSDTIEVDHRLALLAQEYNEVRWTMPSGRERTVRMTRIMTSMIDRCREIPVADVDELLSGEDRGLRLLGVAFLNARSDPSRVPQLVAASVTEDKPFNEYWALQTLRKTLQGNCNELTPVLRLRLQERMNALPRGVDRWKLIQAILSDCP